MADKTIEHVGGSTYRVDGVRFNTRYVTSWEARTSSTSSYFIRVHLAGGGGAVDVFHRDSLSEVQDLMSELDDIMCPPLHIRLKRLFGFCG